MIDFHADTIFQLWKNESAGNLYENSLSVSIKGLENIGALARTDAAGAIVDQVYAILDRTNTGEKK